MEGEGNAQGFFFSVTLLVTDNQMTSFNSIIQRCEHDWEISRMNPINGKMFIDLVINDSFLGTFALV